MIEFFFHPILRAPTLGSIFMCISCSLVGVLVFLRKESLLAEALSHASYPGVLLGVIASGLFFPSPRWHTFWAAAILIGAFLTAIVGLLVIHSLIRRFRISTDAALCFVLSSFFGLGILLASSVQFSFTSLYVFAQSYLYGQAATMTDGHILLYGILCLLVIGTLLFLYKEWQAITFDPVYAESLGIPVGRLDRLLIFLVALSVVVGIRSVGVVLISGMFVAPAVAARQYSHRLWVVFLLSSVFGSLSGFLGNYLSVRGTEFWAEQGVRFHLPTGPMILLCASGITLVSLLFAPLNGLVWRRMRILRFRYLCLGENILKAMWRRDPEAEQAVDQIATYHPYSRLILSFRLLTLQNNGWVEKVSSGKYRLTPDGRHRAEKIVRFHRLWEVYLADYVGVGGEKVHLSAEEMEHVLTPALEQELTLLLRDPKLDPHHQPIPPRGGVS